MVDPEKRKLYKLSQEISDTEPTTVCFGTVGEGGWAFRRKDIFRLRVLVVTAPTKNACVGTLELILQVPTVFFLHKNTTDAFPEATQ